RSPSFPENYKNLIGRTGRAEQEKTAILFYTENEKDAKETIEKLMDLKIEELDFPEEVEISKQLTYEEQPQIVEINNPNNMEEVGPAFHEIGRASCRERVSTTQIAVSLRR